MLYIRVKCISFLIKFKKEREKYMKATKCLRYEYGNYMPIRDSQDLRS